MGFTVDETTTLRQAERLAILNGSQIEWIEDDNRHGLGDRGWRTFRFEVWNIRRTGKRWRRFYLHSSGFVVEGGRGGARIFEPPTAAVDLPRFVILAFPFARVSSIDRAATIVEALTR